MKFPDNYTLWVHKKGVKTDQYNARTDAYLFGAPHLGPRTARSSQASPTVFRSPMEFVPHAIWLMRGCTGQCDCKYCIPGQNQKDINRRLNHGVDADSDDDDDNNGGSGMFQNAAATADRFANIILPQLRVVEALTPVRVASDVIGRLRSISVPREIIGSGLQILVHRLRSMSTRLGTIRTGPQILVRRPPRELFLTKGAICWALGSSQLLLSVFFLALAHHRPCIFIQHTGRYCILRCCLRLQHSILDRVHPCFVKVSNQSSSAFLTFLTTQVLFLSSSWSHCPRYLAIVVQPRRYPHIVAYSL